MGRGGLAHPAPSRVGKRQLSLTRLVFFGVGLLEVSKTIPGYGGAVTGPEISFLCVAAASACVFIFSSSEVKRVPQLSYLGVFSTLLLVVSLLHSFSPIFSNRDMNYTISLSAVLFSGYLKRLLCQNVPSSNGVTMVGLAYAFGISLGLLVPYVLAESGLVSSRGMFAVAGRYQGFLSHPNQVGISCTFVITLAVLLKANLFWRLAIIIPAFVALLLCGSKFNLIVSLFVLLVGGIFAMAPGGVLGKAVTSGVAVIVAAIGAPVFFSMAIGVLMQVNPGNAQRLASFAAAPERSNSALERVYIWGEGMRGGWENMPLGVGLNDAPTYLNGLVHAHNIFVHYFLVWGGAGIMFVAALIWFVVLRGVTALRSKKAGLRETMPYMAGLLSVLLASSISDSLSVTIMPLAITMVAFIMSRDPPLLWGNARRAIANRPTSDRCDR